MKKSLFSYLLSVSLLATVNILAQPHPVNGMGGRNPADAGMPRTEMLPQARPNEGMANGRMENNMERHAQNSSGKVGGFFSSGSEDEMKNGRDAGIKARQQRIEERRERMRMENPSPDQKERMIESREEKREKFEEASPKERMEMRKERREKRHEQSEERQIKNPEKGKSENTKPYDVNVPASSNDTAE